jgi:urea transport system substrate-binding protein
VVWKLDRLSRSLRDLLEIINQLHGRDVGFQSLTEKIDTNSAGGKLIFHVIGALAEFERSMIVERTNAGLDAARKRGVKLGPPEKISPEQWQVIKDLIAEAGGEHVGQVEFIPLDVTEFNSTIQRIQQAQPDVLMTFLVGAAHVNFYRQFAAAGLNKKIPIISTNFGSGNEHIILSPKEVEGLVVCAAYFDDLDTPINREFQAAMKKSVGDPNHVVGEQGTENYNGWKLWAKAVEMAQSFEREPVTTAMETGIAMDTPLGPIQVEPKTHHLIYTMHLAALNEKRGWNILESYENVPPSDTLKYCDLIAKPDQHTQYQPE